MPFVETRFISPTTLTTSASSALYTVPTGYSAIIKQLVVTNTTGTAATFTFYIGAASAGIGMTKAEFEARSRLDGCAAQQPSLIE